MPKATIEELHDKLKKAIFRSHLRKIVEIYDLEWRTLHELIQNAIDAVQADNSIELGKVDVLIDLDEEKVKVTDNGIGFPHDLNLLVPGGTGEEKRLSSRSPAKGYQGVGLKAVMYSSNLFEIEAKTKQESWTFISEYLNRYVDPDDETFVPDYDEEVVEEKNEATGTLVTARFPEGTLATVLNGLERFFGEDTVKWKTLYRNIPDDKDRCVAYINHFIGWYFRTHTYVGCVNTLLNIPVNNPDTEEWEDLKPVEIKITLKSETGWRPIKGELGQWLQDSEQKSVEIELPYRSWDYAEIVESNLGLEKRYRVAPELVNTKPSETKDWNTFAPTFRDKFLVVKLLPNEKKTDFRERYAEFIPLIERTRSRARAEDYKDLFQKVTGIYLAIGRTAYFETLGFANHGLRYIASNGTPTAHQLNVRTTSSTWYLETIHMIINVDDTLNIGKRHLVNTRLVGRVNDFFQECYPNLVAMSKLFVQRDTAGPDVDPMPEVVDLPVLRREGVPFRRFPNDENSLIGLFSICIAQLDEEFSVYGYFGKARYDGKFMWSDEEVRSDSDCSKLEFKLRLDDLLEEFDHAIHEKEFTEVSAIIVWDRRTSKTGWHVKGISEARRGTLEGKGVPTDLIEFVVEDLHGNYRPLISVPDILQRIPTLEGEDDSLDEFVKELG